MDLVNCTVIERQGDRGGGGGGGVRLLVPEGSD